MPASEAWRDAPVALRKVRHRDSFTDYLGGVPFVRGEAQAGMPGTVLSRLLGIGLPLIDLGPWEPLPVAVVAPPVEAPPAPDAPPPAAPQAPAPPDAPAVAAPSAVRPAPSPPSRHDRHRR